MRAPTNVPSIRLAAIALGSSPFRVGRSLPPESDPGTKSTQLATLGEQIPVATDVSGPFPSVTRRDRTRSVIYDCHSDTFLTDLEAGYPSRIQAGAQPTTQGGEGSGHASRSRTAGGDAYPHQN